MADNTPELSPRTLAEQEHGRKMAEINGKAIALAEERRAAEEAAKKAAADDKDEATRNAKRPVFPHAEAAPPPPPAHVVQDHAANQTVVPGKKK